MEQTKVKGIVIGGIDYKEKDKLITLFTLEQGIVSVLFKSVKSTNAKLKAAKEIMTFGEFIYTDSKYKTVTSAEIIDSFYDITKNIKKYFAVCSVFDIIKASLPSGENSPKLFVDTLQVLKELAYQDTNITLVLCKYLISVFETFGYKITFNKCSICGQNLLVHKVFNFAHGDITCFACKSMDSTELSDAVYSCLRLVSITDFNKLSTLKLNADSLALTYGILAKNFECRFGKKLEYALKG